jgi:hypothetical protein
VPEVGSQERHTEEFVKLTFELCKQLTTLSTAGALIVLAVYRELTFGEKLLAATLVLFGLTVIVSLMIMAAGTTYFTARGRASRERGVSIPVEPILLWGSWSAASLFVAGCGPLWSSYSTGMSG